MFSPQDHVRRRSSLLAMAAVCLALVAGLGILDNSVRSIRSNSAVQPPNSSATQPGETTVDPAERIRTETTVSSQQGDAARSSGVSRAFVDHIDHDGLSYGIAYSTARGIVVLDATGISEPDVRIAQAFEQVSELEMMTGQGRTWAVDADDRSRSYLVSNMFVVVDAERPGTVAVIDADERSIGLMAAGLPIPGIEVPEGAELIAVQNRGVLVLPRSGGTLELSGTAGSLVQLSDQRAVSANTAATVFERCDGDLDCTYTVEPHGPAGDYPILIPPGSVVDVSPTGRWVLLRTDELVVLIDGETGTTVDLGSESVTTVSWAPGGEFVALARSNKIDVYLPDQARLVTLDTNESKGVIALAAFVSQHRSRIATSPGS